MPAGSYDPNILKVVNEIKNTNKELHELTRIVKVGLGVTPTSHQSPGPEAEVIAENVPVRFDWLSPAIRGQALILTAGGKVQITIDISPEDVDRFLESTNRDKPELLQVSSMDRTLNG